MSAAKMNSLQELVFDSHVRAEFDCLARRVAELEQSNFALRRSKQDLERFAFATSHDLQEPLRMISSSAQFLASKCKGLLDQDSEMFVGNIVDGATRMRDLLADLVAYTELAAHPQATPEAVDLSCVVEFVKQNLKASIGESCAVIIRNSLPLVSAHARDFVSLFQNFLSNAIKYRSAAPRAHPHLGAARRVGTEICCLRQRHRNRTEIPGGSLCAFQ